MSSDSIDAVLNQRFGAADRRLAREDDFDSSPTVWARRFCEALMGKYGKPDTTRPQAFFPRVDAITVCAIAVEGITGKEMALPPLSEQWPAKDGTKTPNTRSSRERL